MGKQMRMRQRFLREVAGDGAPTAGGGGAAGDGGGDVGGSATPEGDGAPATGTDPAGDGDGWSPPTREEYDALQARLTKVNAEATKNRLRAKAAEEKLATSKPAAPSTPTTAPATPAAPEATAPPAPTPPAADATTAELARYQKQVMNQSVRLALTSAGFQNPTKERLGLAMRTIDTSALELDDNGDLDGIDEQIALLKQAVPEFFTAPKAAPAGPPPPSKPAARKVAAGVQPPATPDPEKKYTTSAARWADIVQQQP